MKVLPFTIPKLKRDLIILQRDEGASFYDLLHQHEEIQLSYIEEGEGTLVVGDTVGFYQPGDIIVLGADLPHVFRSNQNSKVGSKMLSIFFTKNSFGANFFEIEELKSLSSFFDRTENGFKIISNQKRIFASFETIFKATRLQRFILFFQLLGQINSAKFEVLSSFHSKKKYGDREGRRMSAVYDYTINHFQQPISLDEIAQEAAMTKNAFCKYFKKRTNKTYITFLNELRIEESCRLMNTGTELNIAEIAEKSGFRNISNFNRKFREIKNSTPREYKANLSL